MPPTDTNNSSLTLPPIDTSNANSQKQSPLVGRISAEIRNHILDLALTTHPSKQEPFEEGAYHCRPGFRYTDVKFDTALLRTCRRIYEKHASSHARTKCKLLGASTATLCIPQRTLRDIVEATLFIHG